MTTEARRHRSSGFTLIEMIVAISLLAIIALISWRALDGIARGRAALTDEMENTRSLNLLFDQISDDARQAVGDRELNAPAFSFSSGQLRIVREVRIDGQRVQWQVVSYRLEQQTLNRYASVPVDSRAALAPLLGGATASPALPLATDVGALRIRAWVRGRGWITDMRDARTVVAVLLAPGEPDAGTSGIRGFEIVVQSNSRPGPGAFTRVIVLRP